LAFSIYLCLGNNRTTQDVANLIGFANRTIIGWRKELNWEARVKDYLDEHQGKFPHELGKTPADILVDVFGVSPEVIQQNATQLARFNDLTKKNPNADPLDDETEKVLLKYQTSMGIMTRDEYRFLLGSMIREFVRKFTNGDIRINSVYEFEKIVKLDLLLMSNGKDGAGFLSKFGQTNVQFNIDGNMNVNDFNSIQSQVRSNPKVQKLIGELWREYNGGNSGRDDDDNIIDVDPSGAGVN